MVRFLYTLFLLLAIMLGNVHAASVPATPVIPSPSTAKTEQQFLRLNVHEAEKLTGKKLSFRDKVRFRVAKLAHRYLPAFIEGEPTAHQKKQGRLSMILGLSGAFLFLVAFIFPPFVFLSLPLGIAALVLGIKSVKGNGNTEGVIGIISGSAIVLIWVLMAIAIAVIISSGGIWG